jgi:hypothetical protein
MSFRYVFKQTKAETLRPLPSPDLGGLGMWSYGMKETKKIK